jgi:antitoxin HicB
MMKYPAIFTPAEEGGFVVTFRDIPEAITQGDDEAEALFMARDVLREAMGVYFDEKRAVPAPSKPQKGERLIDLPLSVAAKVHLLNAMLAQDVAPSELARRLGTTRQEVNRLTDLEHATKIDRIAEAMSAMGRELDLVAN